MLLTLLIAPTLTHDIFSKSKDSKAKDAIVKAIGKSVEGKWSKIDIASYSVFGSNATITPWNKTKGPVIPPPPLVCKSDEHPENGKCVPNVIPNPNASSTTVVCMVGDISGTAVRDGMKSLGCDDVIALGDLNYASTLDSFIKDYGSNDFTVIKCVIGNHDSSEDGSGSIIKQAKAFCGDSWWFKVGNATLFVGINTNGNLDVQLGAIQDILMNDQFMSGITSVHFVSHKAICSTPPNSHHPLELDKTLCNNLIQYTPTGVKVYFENAHNHVYAETKDSLTKTVGSGGRSHYTCGTDQIWIYCNDKNYGFLAYTIADNGDTVGHFYGSAGNLIR